LLLLATSAFFSGSESAIFSLSRYELSRLSKSRTGRILAELLQHPRRVLLTLMIGNVTLNMFIFALSLSLFRDLGSTPAIGAALGLISPFLVTLAGDILPKSTAILLRLKFAPAAAPIIRAVQIGLAPVIWILLHGLVMPLTRLLTGPHAPDEYVTTEELDELIEISEQRRIIDADENAMLGEVIRLSELHVYDVMVPRVDVVAFDIHDDPADLRQFMREQKLTRVPVYDGEIDKILGLVYAKDLFLNPSREPGTLVRPVKFVPELVTLMQLIEHFRRSRTELAIAVNEYGEMTGLVEIEDVASQIVGDLAVEGRPPEKPRWIKLDERRYRVSGGISIHEWSEQFSFRGLEDSVTTLAGLIQARLGRLPAPGDEVQLGNLKLTVESLDGRRVEWVLLERGDGHEHAPHDAPRKEVRP
jgi:CBS domain containing-hemolysin-like protein